MDRRVERDPFWKRHRLLLSVISLAVAGLVFLSIYGTESGLQVEKGSVSIQTIRRGVFHEFIALDGTTRPTKVMLLEAESGGTVQSIERRPGDSVKVGELILVLRNPTLELEVMERQTLISEQLTSLNSQRLSINQQEVELEAQLITADHEAALLERQRERSRELTKHDIISTDESDKLFSEFEKQKALAKVYRSRLKQHQQSSEAIRGDIARNRERLAENQSALSKLIDGLKLRATVDGLLDMPFLEIGRTLQPGEKLGRIYSPDDYNVVIDADEVHGSRISQGLRATTHIRGQEHELKVKKVYPSVKDGSFQLDLAFVGDAPDGLKPGQRLDVRLELSAPKEVTLLPVGAFYSKTGGRWVYVVDPETDRARRVDLKLGRKNPHHYEVLGGLKPGDRVITSDYEQFGDAPALELSSSAD